MRWNDFSLVQRFYVLSAVCVCGLYLALGIVVTTIHSKRMIHSEVSATQEFLHNLIEDRFPRGELTADEFKRNVGEIS